MLNVNVMILDDDVDDVWLMCGMVVSVSVRVWVMVVIDDDGCEEGVCVVKVLRGWCGWWWMLRWFGTDIAGGGESSASAVVDIVFRDDGGEMWLWIV